MDFSSKSDFLAAEHRRNVDGFIDAVVSIVPCDLGIEGQNELGVKLRFHVENRLVPGLLAVVTSLLEAGPEALETGLPSWIEQVSTALPSDAETLTEAGRQLDPDGYALLEENLGLSPARCLAVEMFHSHFLSLTHGS